MISKPIMTARTQTIKTGDGGRISSTSRAVRAARKEKSPTDRLALVWAPILLLILLQIKQPTECGFSKTRESQPEWRQQPQFQQQQYEYRPPPSSYPHLAAAPNVGPPSANYPAQGGYPSARPASGPYPMDGRMDYGQNYRPQPPHDYRPVPVPSPMGPPPMGPPPMGPPPKQPQPQQQQQAPRMRSKSNKADPCGAIGISEMHGYQVRQYKVLTKDNYELVLHRLVHPADVRRMIQENLDAEGRAPSEEELRRIEPKLGNKKPYLLLHGLVGSSASFVRNVDKQYAAPQDTYNVVPEMEAILARRAAETEHHWQSTADKLNAAFTGDTSNTLESSSLTQKLTNTFTRRTFAGSQLIDFYGDRVNFAYEFTQAHRKFELPRDSLKGGKFVANSLAFTLSNFGYDVWLVNLRGNEYSRGFNGPLSPEKAEYWNFNLERLVREDLLASVNQIKKTLGWKQDNNSNNKLGIISYSYSSLHVLYLLTKFPQYQQTLQPVIMMAPTLLSASDKSFRLKFFIKRGADYLISHTGPFPSRADGKKKISLEHLICKFPVASKLCNLMTIILHGQPPKSVKDIILDDREQAMMMRDSQCGQTSTGVLHQIVENISHHGILPEYTPYVASRDKLNRGELRRSIMIIRSRADEIANEAETARIKEAAIKGMILADVVIEEPKFGHTDFLFSKKNQFLVNAEVARMALVFDFMSGRESANRKIDLG